MKKIFITVISCLFIALNTLTAAAAPSYDIDFTVKPLAESVQAGETFTVNIVITSSNAGYKNFEFKLEFDSDLVKCESESYDKDGYTGQLTQDGIFILKYAGDSSTQIGDKYTASIEFMSRGADEDKEAKFNGEVLSLKNGNGDLKPATILEKKVVIKEGVVQEESTEITTEDVTLSQADDVSDVTPQEVVTPVLLSTSNSQEENGLSVLEIVIMAAAAIIIFILGYFIGYKNGEKRAKKAAVIRPKKAKSVYDLLDEKEVDGADDGKLTMTEKFDYFAQIDNEQKSKKDKKTTENISEVKVPDEVKNPEKSKEAEKEKASKPEEAIEIKEPAKTEEKEEKKESKLKKENINEEDKSNDTDETEETFDINQLIEKKSEYAPKTDEHINTNKTGFTLKFDEED